jgi:hypothetical protein
MELMQLLGGWSATVKKDDCRSGECDPIDIAGSFSVEQDVGDQLRAGGIFKIDLKYAAWA